LFAACNVWAVYTTKTGGIKMEHGVRWSEISKKDFCFEIKQKFFRTEKLRAKFVEKLHEKDNFVEIIGYQG